MMPSIAIASKKQVTILHNQTMMKADKPLVVYDGILMKCSTLNQAYIPEESISLEDLVATLNDGLLNHHSPCNPQEGRKTSRKGSQMFERTPYRPFYKERIKSDGDIETEETFLSSFSPAQRKSSSASNGIPYSILIPLRKDSNLGEDVMSEDEVFDDNKQSALKVRLMDQLNWMKTKGDDCVALETLDNIQETIILIKIFMALKTPAALEFKINNNSTITVSYQFLHNFKNDFMMLKVHENYCMFLSPF